MCFIKWFMLSVLVWYPTVHSNGFFEYTVVLACRLIFLCNTSVKWHTLGCTYWNLLLNDRQGIAWRVLLLWKWLSSQFSVVCPCMTPYLESGHRGSIFQKRISEWPFPCHISQTCLGEWGIPMRSQFPCKHKQGDYNTPPGSWSALWPLTSACLENLPGEGRRKHPYLMYKPPGSSLCKGASALTDDWAALTVHKEDDSHHPE